MQKKSLLLILTLIMGVLAINPYLWAHGTGPHGGKTMDIPPYHLEYDLSTSMSHFYVLDQNNKTLPTENITGKMIVQIKDGTKKELPLSIMGDALMAGDIGITGDFVAIVMLKIKDKTYTARITYDPKEKEETHSESSTTQKNLKGKIVDISCYLTHNSEGASHKACARECALKGLPMGLLAEDGYIYQIIPIGHVDPKMVNETLLDYLEEKVVIDGIVSEKNGMRVMMINKIEKQNSSTTSPQ